MFFNSVYCCLYSKTVSVRKNFVLLLRIINHLQTIRWRKVCSIDYMFKRLTKEPSPVVRECIAGLLKYQYFQVKSYDDKGTHWSYSIAAILYALYGIESLCLLLCLFLTVFHLSNEKFCLKELFLTSCFFFNGRRSILGR